MLEKKSFGYINLNSESLEQIENKVRTYFERAQQLDSKVYSYNSDDELKSLFKFELNDSEQSDKWLVEFIDQFLQKTVNTAHPNFSNQLFSGLNDIALLGEILTAITNTTMAVYESSPLAHNFERAVIKEILSRIGFNKKEKHGDGIMTPGGSYSNFKALLAARNWLYPETKKYGVRQNFIAFTSEKAHYSLGKAANMTGIGEGNVRYVKTLANATIDPHDFQQQVKHEIALGNQPLFVQLTAGTTEYGTFDAIEPIVKIAKQHNIWVHIDGAWGGAVVFSKNKRDRLKGIEQADSFSWDAHKVLGIPLFASFFLINRPLGSMEQIFGSGDGDYLFHGDSLDLGKKSLQCARRNDALKVWLLFQYFGKDAVANTLDKLFDRTEELAKNIETDPDFELVMQPDFLNVCFSVKNNTCLSNPDFHKRIRDNMKMDGHYFFNYTARDDKNAFFRIITNLNSTLENFENLKTKILEEAKSL